MHTPECTFDPLLSVILLFYAFICNCSTWCHTRLAAVLATYSLNLCSFRLKYWFTLYMYCGKISSVVFFFTSKSHESSSERSQGQLIAVIRSIISSVFWEVGHVPFAENQLILVTWLRRAAPTLVSPILEQLLIRVNDVLHKRSGFKLISEQHFLIGTSNVCYKKENRDFF